LAPAPFFLFPAAVLFAMIDMKFRQRPRAGCVSFSGHSEGRVSHQEESLWVERAQAGDGGAFALLVDRYWAHIQRWLTGMTGDVQSAEDLTQEAFLKGWSGLRSFIPGTNFRAWLFCIARRTLIDSQRCGRTRPGRLPEGTADHSPGPVSTLIGQETQALIRQAIERLPLTFRAAFLLRTQEELSYEEIARVLELTEETVRWRVFKARKLLLKDLGKSLDLDQP
jgi:RNA polymerase sigma-70 factor, ECF subfamily